MKPVLQLTLICMSKNLVMIHCRYSLRALHVLSHHLSDTLYYWNRICFPWQILIASQNWSKGFFKTSLNSPNDEKKFLMFTSPVSTTGTMTRGPITPCGLLSTFFNTSWACNLSADILQTCIQSCAGTKNTVTSKTFFTRSMKTALRSIWASLLIWYCHFLFKTAFKCIKSVVNTGQADPGCYGASHLKLFFFNRRRPKCAADALDFFLFYVTHCFNSVITLCMKSDKWNKKNKGDQSLKNVFYYVYTAYRYKYTFFCLFNSQNFITYPFSFFPVKSQWPLLSEERESRLMMAVLRRYCSHSWVGFYLSRP